MLIDNIKYLEMNLIFLLYFLEIVKWLIAVQTISNEANLFLIIYCFHIDIKQ